jgi:Tol biopolymer transport system component
MTRIAFVILGVAFAVGTLAAQDLDRLFKAAVNTEQVDGNVEEAIEQYKKVAAGTNRALAAQALLRMAEAYQKLGRAESMATYQRIIRDLPDQPGAVAVARERLGIQRQTAASSPAGTGVEAIQLWEGGDIEGNPALSPDGRYLAFSSWSADGNLLIKDLTTGVVRSLTRDAALRTGGAQAYSPVFSPDGRRIAFAWYAGSETSLRIVDVDGSNRRVLAARADIDVVYGWSPDGRIISINLYDGGESRLALVAVADGSIVPLKSTSWRKANVARFSPDGGFLAYSVPSSEATPGGVFTLAINGTSEAKIADGRDPAWTPDGRAVTFVSDRTGTRDLWVVSVAKGAPTATPEILRRQVPINHGFTADGRLFYGIRSTGRDVLVTRITPNGAQVDDPTPLTDAFIGSNGGASWSPDGQRIAFVRGSDRFDMQLMVRTLATGAERAVDVKLDDGLIGQNQGGRWFPDGRSLLIRDRVNGRAVFKKINVDTGSQQVLFGTANGGSLAIFDLSPDGRFLFYVESGDEAAQRIRTFRVIKRDIDTGLETELHRASRPDLPAVGGLTVSPDGRHIAIRDHTRSAVLLLPVGGGAPVELKSGTDEVTPIAWTHDGRHVLGVVTANGRDQLRLLALSGDPGVNIAVQAENISRVSVSRVDGRAAVSVLRPHHELWLVRNLLSASGNVSTR